VERLGVHGTLPHTRAANFAVDARTQGGAPVLLLLVGWWWR